MLGIYYACYRLTGLLYPFRFWASLDQFYLLLYNIAKLSTMLTFSSLTVFPCCAILFCFLISSKCNQLLLDIIIYINVQPANERKNDIFTAWLSLQTCFVNVQTSLPYKVVGNLLVLKNSISLLPRLGATMGRVALNTGGISP